MFLDVNNLVQMQGEMVTRIEDHINSEISHSVVKIYFSLVFITGAAIDIERGRDDLSKAKNFKEAALKKKILCFGILIVAVIIILLSE